MFGALLFISAVFLIFFVWVKWRYSYWKTRGVTQIAPEIPFGNIKNIVLKRSTLEECSNVWYNELKKKKQKHGGIYFLFKPFWMPIDTELVQRILIKDFQHFTDHSLVYRHDAEMLTNHVFNAGGEQWRKLRSSLTPLFTLGRLKNVSDIVASIGQVLEKKVAQSVHTNESLLIKDVSACFLTDVMASCGFGVEINTIENPKSEFRDFGRKVFEPRPVKALLELLFPWDLLGRLGYRFYDQKTTKYFIDVINDTVQSREKNNYYRNDFLQLLLQQKNKGALIDFGDGVLSKDEMIVNVFALYLAGFETSSTATSFLMYELSKHQDVQDKLRDEIITVLEKYGGNITYDGVQEMKYADQCIEEIVRLYPPIPTLPRTCTKTYAVPDSDVVIDKGTIVIIPIMSIQRDPDIYPNPEEFNPENFSKENKASRPVCTWMSFGEGPRQCVGLRFAYLQIKVALASLLKNYRYTLNQKTPNKLRLSPDSIALTSKEEIWLDVSKVS